MLAYATPRGAESMSALRRQTNMAFATSPTPSVGLDAFNAMKSSPALTRGSTPSSAVLVLARRDTPSGSNLTIRVFAGLGWPKSDAMISTARRPAPSKSILTLEMAGEDARQMVSSSSAPRIAASPGTASPASRHAPRTSRASRSLPAKTPKGRGSSESQRARDSRSLAQFHSVCGQ